MKAGMTGTIAARSPDDPTVRIFTGELGHRGTVGRTAGQFAGDDPARFHLQTVVGVTGTATVVPSA